ncbi:MAG: hypothetical protein IJ837_03665 [Clostridia bacterium]|nr:hypothetical protein [Clostridia bacterium]
MADYEFNKFTNEFNKTNIINDENILKSKFFEQETNKNQNFVKEKKKKNFLFSKFVILLALTAVVQTVFYIPIFSDIFSPSPPSQVSTPTVSIFPNYTFNSVVETDKNLTFSLTIENADLENENYFLYLVKKEDASDKYLNSIPIEVRESDRIKITNQTNVYSFQKYITPLGSFYVIPETDYMIIVAKNDEIVQTKSVKTASKIYFSDVNVFFENEKINIKLKADSSFKGFGTLLIQVKNLTDSTWGPQNNGVDKTTGVEDNLAGDKYNFSVTKSSVDQYFELKIYCITTDSEKIALPDSIICDDTYYYLIYTYDKPLILKGE